MGARSEVSNLLVDRLYELYPVDSSLGSFTGLTVERLESYPPIGAWLPERFRLGDTTKYDRGRVHFFYLQLVGRSGTMSGMELDPIIVDNVCEGGVIYPAPIVLDGHHRFMAYKLAKRRTIPASYGGRIDVLRYLEGKRKQLPEE